MAGQMLVVRPCPVCGKGFIPAELHVYRIRLKPTSGYDQLVCSWTCLRTAEKMADEQRKRSARTVQGVGKRKTQ